MCVCERERERERERSSQLITKNETLSLLRTEMKNTHLQLEVRQSFTLQHCQARRKNVSRKNMRRERERGGGGGRERQR